ncbi:MAG: tRNA uridine-5-carboxymethylaminomethyl(34) synthesis enzyme MnmG [Planctomycetota bacterium]|nr:tRNA uridine-5-carboxymethylaminomethyl(34) synthesis enzyme MnmG [Planctomycetota bacterium]
MLKNYDVLVIGGGHAGLEAAAVVARLGLQAGLVSLEANAIGRMSCNPAIGGIGKGQLTREIDALGGWMGLITDRAGIQFRMLNTSKGRAVQSPRAQCDRDRYERIAQEMVAQQEGLSVIEGEAVDLLWNDHQILGVVMADGREYFAKAVVLTTGTFLEGLLHTGLVKTEGGRVGEAGAAGLGEALRKMKLPTARLKTGTPPRIAADSVDYSVMSEQYGDEDPVPFSFMNDRLEGKQVVCWQTTTVKRTQEIVRDNLHLAPMYAGRIEGVGPRYCPSLEDKVVRFAERDAHNIFLEPEGLNSNLLYANGISTSLPVEIQEQFVRTCVGMENAVIVQPGYAVEYTHVAPRCLHRTLELRDWSGLYLAGQICGTSGYEEAAAQGLMAGWNAALKILGRDSIVLGRHEAYIGVLIDDLVVSDPTEPYRMFTSRAEHRLLLRHDNADIRLTPIAQKFDGCSVQRFERYQARKARLDLARGELGVHLALLRHPKHGGWQKVLADVPESARFELTNRDWETLEADVQYEGYVKRQTAWVERSAEREATLIPADFIYAEIKGFRNEARLTLEVVRPETLGSAGRLAGVTPADIALLEISLARVARSAKVAEHDCRAPQ